MSEGHQQPTPDQVYMIEAQHVSVADFPAEGFILDIGGGGEGIIGQLKGAQVVAIDPIRRELAPGGHFRVWDGVVPPKREHTEKFFDFHLQVSLPGNTVSTGYGLPWPEEGFDLEHYLLAAQAAGFKVVGREQRGMLFYLELEKPF